MIDKQALKQARAEARLSRRRQVIRSAVIFVLAPTALSLLYFLLIAPPQYESTAAFTVRGTEISGGGLLGAVGLAAPSEAQNDLRIVADYIRSPAMVRELRESSGFDEAYSRFSLDPFSHLPRGAPIERATDFWRSKVAVVSDGSGGTTISVMAPNPDDALRLAQGTLNASEQLVNSLSEEPQTNVRRVSEAEVERARQELDEAKQRLAAFQARSTALPADAPAQQAAALVGSLDAQIATARAELAQSLATYRPDAPRPTALRNRIASLETERQRAISRALAAPGQGAASTEVEARTMLLDYELAQRMYQAAVQGLEQSRRQAGTDQKYIVSYVPPQKPEQSNYWSRLSNVIAVFFAALILWGIGALTFSVVKDHMR